MSKETFDVLQDIQATVEVVQLLRHSCLDGRHRVDVEQLSSQGAGGQRLLVIVFELEKFTECGCHTFLSVNAERIENNNGRRLRSCFATRQWLSIGFNIHVIVAQSFIGFVNAFDRVEIRFRG